MMDIDTSWMDDELVPIDGEEFMKLFVFSIKSYMKEQNRIKCLPAYQKLMETSIEYPANYETEYVGNN